MKSFLLAITLFASTPAFMACSTPERAIQKYDTLVEKDQVCEEKWANIEANLQRRYDLIPNLVEVVKASAKFEQKTLVDLETAQHQAKTIVLQGTDFYDEQKMMQWQMAQTNLRNSMMVFQKAYPELQASKDFKNLMTQVEGTENRLLRSREEYNKSVRDYNTELRRVSGVVINTATGQPFKPRVFFGADAYAKKAPKVDFSDK